MANETSKLTITIDVKQATIEAQKLIQKIDELKRSGAGAGIEITRGMAPAGPAIQKVGDQAAASAVKFQTLTQGLLNLGTTGVQVFTSVSNLARAHNRAAAAAVGQQRAQDALNRFQIKYNKLVESGTATTRDLTQAQNELTTATADYTVKAEKAKIETEAVLDIQLLFAANLSNVVVSSLQVVGALLSDTTKARITSTIATKAHTIANWNNSNSLFRNNIALTTNATGYYRNALGAGVATGATRSLTFAQKALTAAMGPIGLIFIGISVAIGLYETNAGNLKTTINGLLGITDDLAKGTDDAAQSAAGFTDILENVNEVAGKKLPTSFKKLTEEFLRMKMEMRATGAEAQEMAKQATAATNSMAVLQAIGRPANLQDFRPYHPTGQVGQAGLSGNNQAQFLTTRGVPQLLGYLNELHAKGTIDLNAVFAKQAKPIVLSPEQIGFQIFGPAALHGNHQKDMEDTMIAEMAGISQTEFSFLDDDKQTELRAQATQMLVFQGTIGTTAGSTLPRAMRIELQRKYVSLLNKQNQEDHPTDFRVHSLLTFGGIENILDPKNKLQSALTFLHEDFQNLGFLPDKKSRPAFIAGLLRAGRSDLVDLIDDKNKDFILRVGTGPAEALNRRLAFMVEQAQKFSAGERVHPMDLSGIQSGKRVEVNQLVRLLSFKAKKGNRAENVFLRELGVDVFESQNGTDNIKIPQNIMRTIRKIAESGSAIRAELFIETGFDIGKVADNFSREDAFRIAKLESSLRSGNFHRSTDQLVRDGLLINAGTEFFGFTLMDGDKVPIKVNGNLITADFKGRKIVLPMGPETSQALNRRIQKSNDKMIQSLGKNQGLVNTALFTSGKVSLFGSKFFGMGGKNTGKGGFLGISATAAFQSIGSPSNFGSREAIKNAKASDAFEKSGGRQLLEVLEFARSGVPLFSIAGRSAADSKNAEKARKQLGRIRAFNAGTDVAFGLGITDSFINSIFEAGFEAEAQKALTFQNLIQSTDHVGGVLAGRRALISEVFLPILSKVGLDTSFIQKLKRDEDSFIYNRGFKVKVKNQFHLVGPTMEEILRTDLGVPIGVNIPAVNIKLVNDAMIFSQNKFSDFNNVNIADSALKVLQPAQGLSAQQLWDIRFNTTKGDRELENRMIFERKQAMATGIA